MAVIEERTQTTKSAMDEDEIGEVLLRTVDLIDNLLRVSDGCSFSPPSIYPEIEDSELACAVQMWENIRRLVLVSSKYQRHNKISGVNNCFDRNNAIIGAVQAIFGSGERHAFCYHHVKENFSTAFTKINRGKTRTSSNMKDDALKLLDAIAYARHEAEFNVAMGNLRLFCPQLAQWVETQGDVDRWAQCKFGYKRWDNITTNLAESFNAWIVKERKHNVNVLIHEHRDKLAKKMVASKAAMGNWKHGVGPNVEAKVMEQVVRAENLHAQIYRENLISVQTISVNGLIHLNVDLAARTCSCLAWQMSGIPCAHACAVIKLLHGNVYNFVDECYKFIAQEQIYATSVKPIATHDCPHPEALTVTNLLTETFLEPPMTRKPPGRPKSKRRESQFQNKKVYHCGICHEIGHTSKTCKNHNPC
ncbi:uncharacterized protein LOC129289209 [Prosopis cineraria]|uniref:uncharacterized protein LOC129289209 n=1 Tax=Prosopis cineraria TaxID=364024 RepID=UPI00240F9228|nr:uncharacterized protein LOC129289209 [Prosopis cineraria]